MGKTTLLLVDDSSLFLSVATRFLTGHGGFELIGTASNACEALAVAEAVRPQVVLLDLNMPHTTGLEVMPRLRRLLPDVKIIVLTLWDSDVYRQAALAAGADDFVPKALMSTNLLPAIRRLNLPAPAPVP